MKVPPPESVQHLAQIKEGRRLKSSATVAVFCEGLDLTGHVVHYAFQRSLCKACWFGTDRGSGHTCGLLLALSSFLILPFLPLSLSQEHRLREMIRMHRDEALEAFFIVHQQTYAD